MTDRHVSELSWKYGTRLKYRRIVVVAANWLFQGMRYMNRYEITVKLGIDGVLTVLFTPLAGSSSLLLNIVLAWFGAHTLNWLINGHFFALLNHGDLADIHRSPETFHRFVRALEQRGRKRKRLDGIAVFGSYCRGEIGPSSDLDVRFIVERGIGNGFAGAGYCVLERIRAFFLGFPLDVYCSVGEEGLARLREDEVPVILLDRSGLLRRKYGQGSAVPRWEIGDPPSPAPRARICVVCSAGGHLTEALEAVQQIRHPLYFVTNPAPHVPSRLGNREVRFVVDPHTSLPLYLKNAWQSLCLFFRKRPRVVISTGAGIALATCLLCKLTGGTLIFVESGARVHSPSRTGRFLYPFADLFVVQWKPLLRYYPHAIHGGPLL